MLAAAVGGVQRPQSGNGVLYLTHHDHGGDDIGLEAGLFIKRHQIAVKYGGVHLALLAAHAGNIGGQAVEIQRFALLCPLHHVLGAGPVLVLCVLR